MRTQDIRGDERKAEEIKFMIDKVVLSRIGTKAL